MSRDLPGRRAGPLERLGEHAMERPPALPRHVGVQRVARERVAERARPGRLLADQPALEQLGQAVAARVRGHELEVEGLARHRRRLGRRARRVRKLGRADEDRVAHGVGERHVAVGGELEPAPTGLQRTADAQRGRQLLDEERQPLGAVVDRAHERRRGCLAERQHEQLGRLLEVERAQDELVEPARAPQLVAQPPHAVVARQAVRPVGRDHEHRQLAERLGERGEQLERRLVGPLQVVEDDERVALRGDAGEHPPHRLEQRRTIRGRGGLAELGHEQRELGVERTGAVERAGLRPQVGAQRGDHRTVRGRAAVDRRAAQEQRVRAPPPARPRAGSCPRPPRRS